MRLRYTSGRLSEALTLVEQAADHSRRAGFSPWTQLGCQVERLQTLNQMGHSARVLGEVQRLRRHMDTLPDRSEPGDTVEPWNVRETLLGAGRDAAHHLGHWQDALDINAHLVASKHARHAPARDIARARFQSYGPLIELGRTDDALDLLLECRQTFHETDDIAGLGSAFTSLAYSEFKRGHGDAAIRLARDALRYHYLAADVIEIAVSYLNLGAYLLACARQPAEALASPLTAALIYALTDMDPGNAIGVIRNAALALRAFGSAADLPASVSDLCRRLGDAPGTDPARLIAQLPPAPETAEQTLRDIVAQTREVAATLAGTAVSE